MQVTASVPKMRYDIVALLRSPSTLSILFKSKWQRQTLSLIYRYVVLLYCLRSQLDQSPFFSFPFFLCLQSNKLDILIFSLLFLPHEFIQIITFVSYCSIPRSIVLFQVPLRLFFCTLKELDILNFHVNWGFCTQANSQQQQQQQRFFIFSSTTKIFEPIVVVITSPPPVPKPKKY